MSIIRYITTNSFLLIIAVTSILLSACLQNSQDMEFGNSSQANSDSLTIIKLNPDSLINIIPGKNGVPNPKVINSGTPKTTETNFNIVKAGKPKIILADKSHIYFIGQDSILLPEKVPAKLNPILAGIPDIVVVKEPFSRDQNPQNFITFGKQQGLNDAFILSMLQDRSGNLWFSSYSGVTKFNGITFTFYTPKEGLKGYPIRSIVEDQSGNLWFGTYGGGVTRFDGKFFTHITVQEGLLNDKVRTIVEDHNGDIWIASDGGLSKFDGKDFTNYTIEQGLLDNQVGSIFEDHINNLWIGSYGGGISRLNADRKSFTHFTPKYGLPNNAIRVIEEDSYGNIWFGTSGGGVWKYDGSNFMLYSEKEGLSNNNVWSIIEDQNREIWFGTDLSICKFDGVNFTGFSKNEGLLPITIKSIVEDINGNLWLGAYGAGIAKYNGKTFTHFTEKEGLPNSIIRSIYEDRKGNLWLGTLRGLSKYNGKSFTNYSKNEGLSDNIIRSIFEDNKGNLWVGTNNGLNKFDGNNFTHFTLKGGISKISFLTIFEDREGNLWFGTWGEGAYKFNGKSFTQFTVKEGLTNNFVWSILEDRNGNIWFGTEGGVSKFDGKSFVHFTQNEGLINNIVWSSLEDPDGNIWFGTFGGITILSKKVTQGNSPETEFDGYRIFSLTEQQGLLGSNVFSIFFDKSGNFNIGTGIGLSIINANKLKDIDLLIKKSIDPSTPIFENYGYDDGFLGIGVNEGKTICETKDGSIWIGASDRLTVYHPKNKNPDTIPPNILITSIEVFNELIHWSKLSNKNSGKSQEGSFGPAKDTSIVLGNGVRLNNFRFSDISPFYGLPIDLSLAYQNNYITFNYIGITLKQSKNVKYQYKLEGIDENWSAITNRTSAPYGNLPHGSYTFKVKAMNGEGFWSREYSYSFTIRPPWWKTVWFRLLSSILIVIVFIGLYKWRISALSNQKRQLEQVVWEKTIEISNQNEELKTLNEEQNILNKELCITNRDLGIANEKLSKQRKELEATLENLKIAQNQIVQSEKMASLGILSAGIAHEINNPLNFIQGGLFGIEEYINENLPEHTEIISKYIKSIDTGIGRATDIVSSLGAYSRKDELLRTNCNVHTIIDNCLIMLNNRLKYKVEVEKDYCEGDYSIEGNEGKLHQAFLNVLSNAEQAIAITGSIRIKTEVDSIYFITYISDTGCGIEKENLGKIFEPFFTTKEPGQGTGLGLSITYKIILDHNGTLEYESQVGEGTTAIIKLPLA